MSSGSSGSPGAVAVGRGGSHKRLVQQPIDQGTTRALSTVNECGLVMTVGRDRWCSASQIRWLCLGILTALSWLSHRGGHGRSDQPAFLR